MRKDKKSVTEGITGSLKGCTEGTIFKPDEDLRNLNLQHYTVIDCEPLHDIKGHLFHELPSVLPKGKKKRG